MTQALPSNRTKWNDVSDVNLLNHPHFLDGQTTAGSKWLSVSRLITYGLITLILFSIANNRITNIPSIKETYAASAPQI